MVKYEFTTEQKRAIATSELPTKTLVETHGIGEGTIRKWRRLFGVPDRRHAGHAGPASKVPIEKRKEVALSEKTNKELVKETGYCSDTITKWRREFKVEDRRRNKNPAKKRPEKRRFTDAERSEIVRCGKPCAAICEDNNISTVTLTQWRKEFGVTSTNRPGKKKRETVRTINGKDAVKTDAEKLLRTQYDRQIAEAQQKALQELYERKQQRNLQELKGMGSRMIIGPQ